jgi:hypothetical protein
MLHSRTSINSHQATIAAILPATRYFWRDLVEDVAGVRKRLVAERAIDDVIADSFPASDPPSWNPGIARLAPVTRQPAAPAATAGRVPAAAIDVLDVSLPPRKRTFVQLLVSLLGATGLALMVPLVILLIGLPFVLMLRGLLHAIGWVFGITTL